MHNPISEVSRFPRVGPSSLSEERAEQLTCWAGWDWASKLLLLPCGMQVQECCVLPQVKRSQTPRFLCKIFWFLKHWQLKMF